MQKLNSGVLTTRLPKVSGCPVTYSLLMYVSCPSDSVMPSSDVFVATSRVPLTAQLSLSSRASSSSSRSLTLCCACAGCRFLSTSASPTSTLPPSTARMMSCFNRLSSFSCRLPVTSLSLSCRLPHEHIDSGQFRGTWLQLVSHQLLGICA